MHANSVHECEWWPSGEPMVAQWRRGNGEPKVSQWCPIVRQWLVNGFLQVCQWIATCLSMVGHRLVDGLQQVSPSFATGFLNGLPEVCQ